MVLPPAEDDAKPSQQHVVDQAMRQEALGALARKISHDFNNILQVLSGRLELIEQVPGLPKVVLEDLRSAQTGVEMAYRLLRQLRAFVLVEDLPTELLTADTLAQSALELARPLLPAAAQLKLTIDEAGLPLKINRALAEGALIELLINAAEACDSQPCAIELQVARGQRESIIGGQSITSSYALLAVRDSGPGFMEPDLTKIFDVFYTTKGDRRGVGLAIARNVARSNDGTLEVVSQPGQGALLTMWLPLAE
jgi:signal transduction histidine kinase